MSDPIRDALDLARAAGAIPQQVEDEALQRLRHFETVADAGRRLLDLVPEPLDGFDEALQAFGLALEGVEVAPASALRQAQDLRVPEGVCITEAQHARFLRIEWAARTVLATASVLAWPYWAVTGLAPLREALTDQPEDQFDDDAYDPAEVETLTSHPLPRAGEEAGEALPTAADYEDLDSSCGGEETLLDSAGQQIEFASRAASNLDQAESQRYLRGALRLILRHLEGGAG